MKTGVLAVHVTLMGRYSHIMESWNRKHGVKLGILTVMFYGIGKGHALASSSRMLVTPSQAKLLSMASNLLPAPSSFSSSSYSSLGFSDLRLVHVLSLMLNGICR